jgi:hypothetical protein
MQQEKKWTGLCLALFMQENFILSVGYVTEELGWCILDLDVQ